MTWDEMIELACSEFGCTAEVLVRTPRIKFSGSLRGARNPSSSPMTVKVSRKQDGRVTKVVHVAFIDGREVPKTNARRYFSASLGLPFNVFEELPDLENTRSIQ